MPDIVPIVEGQSEVQSIGVLLRRLFHEHLCVYDINVAFPFRVKRNKVVRPGELEDSIQTAILKRANTAAVLVLLDADVDEDDELPCVLAPNLLARARTVTRLPISVVLANREFEAWFLGAKESLRGERGVRIDATNVVDPERIRGARERLTSNMEQGRRYVEVDDQPALAAKMDLDMARQNCPSFDKLVREVERLVREMNSDISQ
jgi:hypothetical protein